MKFKCNAKTDKHTNDESRISTLTAVDHYSSSITSGVVNISTDINNGALGTKNYSCPICHEKLLWDKKYEVNGNKLGSATGTFTMLNDDNTVANIKNQYGVDRSEDSEDEDDNNISNDNIVETETLPEYGQFRYNYKRNKWISETETEEQKKSMSWKDPRTGITYYGTKAMNHIERGIFEANRNYSFKELQTKNLASALLKLRMNEETSIAMWGDSIFAGFWYVDGEENKGKYEKEDSLIDDYGVKYEGYDRCVKRIPETMETTLNKVYNNKIKVTRKVWNGVTVCNKKTANGKPVDYGITSHWKASEKDIAIMNFGINDAIGLHLDTSYAGNVSQFIAGYKALIERELEHGTAVIIMSPVRQCTVGIQDMKKDLDDRTIIDVYEQSLYSLCQEYGIPFIDGSLMLKNFGSELYLDLSHLQPEGNESIGKRLASILIGQNPLRPLKVNHNSYLSVIPQYSNCKLTGTADFSYSETSPNIKTGLDIQMKFPQKPGTTPGEPSTPDKEDTEGTEEENPITPAPEGPSIPGGDSEGSSKPEVDGEEAKDPSEENNKEPGTPNQGEDAESPSVRTSIPTEKPEITIKKPEGAIQCELKKSEDSIVWSFYAEHDGMVVIPTFETETTSGSVLMELDFGATQGSWANYWNFKEFTTEMKREEYEPSLVTYKQSDLKDHRYGYHMINKTYNKAIKIVSEGWHTIRLEAKDLADNESIKVFGITFMDIKEFENATKASN